MSDSGSVRVRGILCFRCNGALGQFEENSEWLERAASYVERHQSGACESPATYEQPKKTCPDCSLTKALDSFPRRLGDDPEIIRRAIACLQRWQNPGTPDAVHEPSVPYILSVA